MKLYYLPGACSLTSHIVLEWIGKAYEISEVPRDQLKKEFLKINPNGAVPVLDIDGWILTQNVAIMNYLADEYPDSELGGDGSSKSRAEINRWLAFINSDMHPAFKPLFGATAYLDDPAAIEKSKDAARKSLRGHFEKANKQLEGRDWLTARRSIADPYLYVLSRWARSMKLDLSGLDHLPAFMQRFENDPAVKKVLKDEGLS